MGLRTAAGWLKGRNQWVIGKYGSMYVLRYLQPVSEGMDHEKEGAKLEKWWWNWAGRNEVGVPKS